jgi:hypothetical protein
MARKTRLHPLAAYQLSTRTYDAGEPTFVAGEYTKHMSAFKYNKPGYAEAYNAMSMGQDLSLVTATHAMQGMRRRRR